jgi:nitroreductase
MRIIKISEDINISAPIENADKYCINCGHCVAVCPHDALSLQTMTPEQCVPIDKSLIITKEQAEQFMRARRSIRTYQDKPVDRILLEKIIGIACNAATALNMQSVKWMIIEQKEEVQKLEGIVVDWMRYMIKEKHDLANLLNFDRMVADIDAGRKTPICNQAPHMILAYGHKDIPLFHENCIIALTHLELAASGFGLGACWAGYLTLAAKFWPPMQEVLALPVDHELSYALMIGYPKYKFQRIPIRKEADIVWR